MPKDKTKKAKAKRNEIAAKRFKKPKEGNGGKKWMSGLSTYTGPFGRNDNRW